MSIFENRDLYETEDLIPGSHDTWPATRIEIQTACVAWTWFSSTRTFFGWNVDFWLLGGFCDQNKTGIDNSLGVVSWWWFVHSCQGTSTLAAIWIWGRGRVFGISNMDFLLLTSKPRWFQSFLFYYHRVSDEQLYYTRRKSIKNRGSLTFIIQISKCDSEIGSAEILSLQQ